MKYIIIGDIRNSNEGFLFETTDPIFKDGGRFNSLEDAVTALELYKKHAPEKSFIINSDEILK